MTNNHKLPRAVLLSGAILIACALAACSSPPKAATSSEGSSAAGNAKASASEPAELPLEAYLSSLTGLSGSYTDIQEKRYQQDLKRERITAQCMKENGFSYTPEATKSTSKSGQYGPSDHDLDSKSWVQKYGYGAVYQPGGTTGALDRESEKGADSKKSLAAASPNSQYRASLTAAGRNAYDKALNGADSENSTLTIARDWQQLGCSGLALHTVPNQNVIMGSSEGKTVEAAVEQFYNGYATWPGVAGAQTAWASCMSSSGFAGYSKQNQPASQIAAENTALWTAAGADGQPSTADLDALARKERTLALADLNCRDKTDYRGTLRRITLKQENQFMADNKVALDALRATLQSGSK